jgi:hypothetical protein
MVRARTDEEVTWALRQGVAVVVDVVGRSMEPSLRPGDRVRVEPLRGVPRLGDIVLLAGPRSLVIHRVVFVARRDLRVVVYQMGDNTRRPSPVVLQEVVGRAVGLEGLAPRPWPVVRDLGPLVWRRLLRGWAVCAAYHAGWSGARALGLSGSPRLKSVGDLCWRILA